MDRLEAFMEQRLKLPVGIEFFDEIRTSGYYYIDKTKLSSIELNEMFPNTSLLFEHRSNSKYIIWNEIYGEMQDDAGKGGYDLFHTFGVVLNDLLLDLCKKKRISNTTFKYAKRKIFIFLQGLYYSEVLLGKESNHTFIIRNIRKSISAIVR